MKPPLIKNLGAPKKSMDDGPKQNFLCPFDEFLGLCQRPSYCTKPSRVKFLHGKVYFSSLFHPYHFEKFVKDFFGKLGWFSIFFINNNNSQFSIFPDPDA